MTLRLSLSLLAALALAGCASLAPPKPALHWMLQASAAAGSALALTDDGGQDVLRLACRTNPPDLYLASDRLKPASSPVQLRIGDRVFALRPTSGEPRLAATAAMPDALPAALLDGGPISVSAGRETLDRLPPPDGKMAAAFVIACRADTAAG
jgi:hypothetical protein